MSNLFESPLSVLEMYLKFNRYVWKAFVLFLAVSLGVTVISLGVRSFGINTYSLIGIGLDFQSIFTILSYFLSSIFLTLIGSVKYIALFGFGVIGAFVSFKFIISIESLLKIVKTKGLAGTFSDRSNFKEINKFLWIILGINTLQTLIFNQLQSYVFNSAQEFSWVTHLIQLFFGSIEYVLLSFHGIQPLIVMLILELIHRIAVRNDNLEKEIEGTV